MTDPRAVAQSFYNALALGDGPAALSALSPDVEWTETEGFPYYSGTWHGPQEVAEKLLMRLGQDWEGFAATVEDYVCNGDQVVSFGVYSGVSKATGKPMRATFCHRWLVRDGKLARFTMYADTLMVHRAMH